MTVSSGAPDWTLPLPVKIKRLIDTDVTLAGGVATVGPFDCIGYTGILLEHLAITGEGSVGFLQVEFDDPQATIFTVPTYVINWKGDKGIKLNIPVLGPQVTLHYVGTFNGHVSHVSAVAHTGGGSASYGRNATVLASSFGAALAVGATATVEPTLIREGPATLTVQQNLQAMRAYVEATDHLGVVSPIADVTASANHGESVNFWLPPYPVTLNVDNVGAAVGSFAAALVLGRS